MFDRVLRIVVVILFLPMAFCGCAGSDSARRSADIRQILLKSGLRFCADIPNPLGTNIADKPEIRHLIDTWGKEVIPECIANLTDRTPVVDSAGEETGISLGFAYYNVLTVVVLENDCWCPNHEAPGFYDCASRELFIPRLIDG